MYCPPTVAPYITTTQSPEMTTSPSGTPKTIHAVKETTTFIRKPRPTKDGEKRHQSGQPGGKGKAEKEES